jgi:hypothetical protein
MTEFFAKEKPALILSMNASGNDGTVFVSSGGSYAKDAEIGPASIMLSSDDYLRLQRLLEAGEKVEVDADVKTKFFTDDIKGYNVVGEIPGSDPSLKEELVMLGGHLDSWHGATGATDNAAGCAVMMEAVRIIKSLGVQPRRTIRIALWSGEEQGLFGSRNYVKNHFADPATMVLNRSMQRFPFISISITAVGRSGVSTCREINPSLKYSAAGCLLLMIWVQKRSRSAIPAVRITLHSMLLVFPVSSLYRMNWNMIRGPITRIWTPTITWFPMT